MSLRRSLNLAPEGDKGEATGCLFNVSQHGWAPLMVHREEHLQSQGKASRNERKVSFDKHLGQI